MSESSYSAGSEGRLAIAVDTLHGAADRLTGLVVIHAHEATLGRVQVRGHRVTSVGGREGPDGYLAISASTPGWRQANGLYPLMGTPGGPSAERDCARERKRSGRGGEERDGSWPHGERPGRMTRSCQLRKAASRSQGKFLSVQLDGPVGAARCRQRVTLDRAVDLQSVRLCLVTIDHQKRDSVRTTAQVVGEEVKIR